LVNEVAALLTALDTHLPNRLMRWKTDKEEVRQTSPEFWMNLVVSMPLKHSYQLTSCVSLLYGTFRINYGTFLFSYGTFLLFHWKYEDIHVHAQALHELMQCAVVFCVRFAVCCIVRIAFCCAVPNSRGMKHKPSLITDAAQCQSLLFPFCQFPYCLPGLVLYKPYMLLLPKQKEKQRKSPCL
jgi:hypothetical protein